LPSACSLKIICVCSFEIGVVPELTLKSKSPSKSELWLIFKAAPSAPTAMSLKPSKYIDWGNMILGRVKGTSRVPEYNQWLFLKRPRYALTCQVSA
tara:strand:+ start:301 stop:588 length:288 start_codon:yes stop_codon:yes gene_type:complete